MPFDGTVENVETNAKTVKLLNALIAHYGLPHPEPSRPVQVDLAVGLRRQRQKLGIKGDKARTCILKAATPDGWWPPAWSLIDVSVTTHTFGALEDILMRAFDCAIGATMRPFKHRPAHRCCSPDRARFLSQGGLFYVGTGNI